MDDCFRMMLWRGKYDPIRFVGTTTQGERVRIGANAVVSCITAASATVMMESALQIMIADAFVFGEVPLGSQ